MRRIFLRAAIGRLVSQLDADSVLLCDGAAWATERRGICHERLLPDLAAIARRVCVYAGARDAAFAHLALEADLQIIAISPPMRRQHTLIVHRGDRQPGPPRPPRVHYGPADEPRIDRSPSGVPVVFGGQALDALLPLQLAPTGEHFAQAVRQTAVIATETIFRDIPGALPWTLIARHRRATVLAPASSPAHVLLAYGTDGQESALLMGSLEFTEEVVCSEIPPTGDPAGLPKSASCARG